MPRLEVYDLDDTLIKSKGIIKLNRGGNEVVYPTETFPNYTSEPGDLLDFTDLNDLSGVRLMLEYWDKMVKGSRSDDVDVLILTSRPPGAASAIGKLLAKFGIEGVSIEALGSGKPTCKVNKIKSMVESNGYDSVFFVDDNPLNTESVSEWAKEAEVSVEVSETQECETSYVVGNFESNDGGVWTLEIPR